MKLPSTMEDIRTDLRNTFVPTHPFITLSIVVFGFLLLPMFAFVPWVFGQTTMDVFKGKQSIMLMAMVTGLGAMLLYLRFHFFCRHFHL